MTQLVVGVVVGHLAELGDAVLKLTHQMFSRTLLNRLG
jgi:hypothetical protein